MHTDQLIRVRLTNLAHKLCLLLFLIASAAVGKRSRLEARFKTGIAPARTITFRLAFSAAFPLTLSTAFPLALPAAFAFSATLTVPFSRATWRRWYRSWFFAAAARVPAATAAVPATE